MMKKYIGRALALLLLGCLLAPHSTYAQGRKVAHRAKTVKSKATGSAFRPLMQRPDAPTPIDVRERTIGDLLFFPFGYLSDNVSTREEGFELVSQIFGTCESVNLQPGLHAGEAFDFTYWGVPVGVCFYNPIDDQTWYHFYFDNKQEAESFYAQLCKDVKGAGIPLAKDKVYGGLSNRKRPVSIFEWVYVNLPEKVKEADTSNIHLPDAVGKYQVEFGVYKRKSR